MTDRFLREREVRSMRGLSRTTRLRLERVAEFPRRRQISQVTTRYMSCTCKEDTHKVKRFMLRGLR
jgi:predicted DNA-binding transcriptional regulator AlpA